MKKLKRIINKHYKLVVKARLEDGNEYKFSKKEHKEFFLKVFKRWKKEEAISKMKGLIYKIETRHEPQWFCAD